MAWRLEFLVSAGVVTSAQCHPIGVSLVDSSMDGHQPGQEGAVFFHNHVDHTDMLGQAHVEWSPLRARHNDI